MKHLNLKTISVVLVTLILQACAPETPEDKSKFTDDWQSTTLISTEKDGIKQIYLTAFDCRKKDFPPNIHYYYSVSFLPQEQDHQQIDLDKVPMIHNAVLNVTKYSYFEDRSETKGLMILPIAVKVLKSDANKYTYQIISKQDINLDSLLGGPRSIELTKTGDIVLELSTTQDPKFMTVKTDWQLPGLTYQDSVECR